MLPLRELCLEINNQCPMHCVHCSTDAIQDPNGAEELSYNEITSIISDFVFLGGEILEISGGEPTLHHSLIDTVEFAKEKGLEVRLYTSGVSTQEQCASLPNQLLNNLYQHGLDKIIFNLQGPVSEIHDEITRTPGSFTALCSSIMIAKKLGFWVGIHFVPMIPNALSIDAVLELSRRYNIDEVALLRFVSQGRGEIEEFSLKMATEDVWNFLEKVVLLRKLYKFTPKIRTGCPFDFLAFIDNTVEHVNCKAGVSTCSITPWGDVIPCPAFKHLPDYVAGSTKNDSLKSIWMNSKLLSFLREIRFKDISVCSRCNKIEVCRGRCLAQRIRWHGDPLKGPDPDCNGPYISRSQTIIQPRLQNQLSIENSAANANERRP